MAPDDLNVGAQNADSNRPPVDSEDLFGFGSFGVPDDRGDDVDLDGWGGEIDDVGSVLEDILGDREEASPLELMDDTPSALPATQDERESTSGPEEPADFDQASPTDGFESDGVGSERVESEDAQSRSAVEHPATAHPLETTDAPPVDADDLFGFEEVESSPGDAIADFGDILGDDLITDISASADGDESVSEDMIESLLETPGDGDTLEDLIEEAEAQSRAEDSDPRSESGPNSAETDAPATHSRGKATATGKSPTHGPDAGSPSNGAEAGSPEGTPEQAPKGPSLLDRLPRQVPAFIKERPGLVLAAIALLLFQVNWITGVRSSLDEVRTLVVSAMESGIDSPPEDPDRSQPRSSAEPSVVTDDSNPVPAELLPDPRLIAARDELSLAHRLALSGAYIEARRRIAGLLAVVDQLDPEDREEIEVQALLQMAEALSGEADDLELSDS